MSGVIGKPSGMYGSGRKALPNVRVWSGGHYGFMGVVGRAFWMSRSGREALKDVRDSLPDNRE